MAHNLVCWKCGADLAALTLPLSRRDECARCRAELHVCRMCVDYDDQRRQALPRAHRRGSQQQERANFCDFFVPRAGAYLAADVSAAERARLELEKLFGKKP